MKKKMDFIYCLSLSYWTPIKYTASLKSRPLWRSLVEPGSPVVFHVFSVQKSQHAPPPSETTTPVHLRLHLHLPRLIFTHPPHVLFIHPSFSLSFYHSPSLSIRSGTTSSSLVVKKNNFFFCVFVLKKNVFFLFEVFAFFCLFVAPLPPTTATTTTSSPSPFYPHPYKDFKKDCPPPLHPPKKIYI